MRKPLVAVVAVVAVLAAVVIAATASVVTIAVHDDETTASGSGSMMSTGAGGSMFHDGARGGWMSGMGSGQMMTGTVARDEFSYLTHMVAHHEEAVDAAQELARSDRPEMQEFGESIIASQSSQIDQMEAWLAAWYPDRSTDVEYEPMMRDLSELSGDELDQAFLQDMVMHHMTAVMMSHQLLMRGDAEHPQVETLAHTISTEQRAEIIQMQRWLSTW